jgi:glycosyltransferase involved in cell wall biosynthesis
LQIVPALREEPLARAALTVAAALLQSGARALVAAEDGPLAAELKAFGGEWVPLVNATAIRFKLRRSAHTLEKLIASERVDIVHAQSVGGAWIASMAAAQVAVWLVTTLPDVPATSGVSAYWAGALARGDRVITPSNFAAAPMIARYALTPERITVIPREIDMAAFDPRPLIASASRHCARPGRFRTTPASCSFRGASPLERSADAARRRARACWTTACADSFFVLAGEHRTHRKYARFIADDARAKGVQAYIRLTGHCRDMPAAFAAADTVVVPAIEPPVLGRVVAQAQAMGRPVVTSDVGILPEHVATPPEIPENVRTGWVAKAGDATEFARALSAALSLDDVGYRTMAARARQFAEYMFSPQSVAEATCAVYMSLLALDA